MAINYIIAEKVYNELDSLDFRNSREKIEIANTLCEKNGICLSDLILYEMNLPERRQRPEKPLSSAVIESIAAEYYEFLNSYPKNFSFQ